MQETVPTQADTCSDSERCLLCSPEMNPTLSEMNLTLAPYFPFRWPSSVCSQPPLPRLCTAYLLSTVQLQFVCLLSIVETLVSLLIHLVFCALTLVFTSKSSVYRLHLDFCDSLLVGSCDHFC